MSVRGRWHSIENYLDQNIPSSTGGDCEVFLSAFEKVAVNNEQRDV
jgi:hypothetical protein